MKGQKDATGLPSKTNFLITRRIPETMGFGRILPEQPSYQYIRQPFLGPYVMPIVLTAQEPNIQVTGLLGLASM